MIKPEESVIVFDLDDTLYSEHDYKCSGIRAVVENDYVALSAIQCRRTI